MGKLGDKKRDLLPKEVSLIKIMKHDFKDLLSNLRSESINSVEIFMDLIYEDLSELIIKSNSFSDKEETLDFEIKVDEIILKAIDVYNDYKVKYIKENYDFLEKEEKENNRNYLLIKELIPIEELNDNEKLFMFTKFHKEEEKENNYFENYILKVGFDACKEKYPLLCRILFYGREVENLKYLPDINNLSNKLINKFSHKISRKEANNKPINHNDFIIDKNLLQKFLNSWNNLNEDNDFIKLSEESPLINFLIDKEELALHNPLNNAYKKLIKQQNEFLKPIIKPDQKKENKDSILYFYFDTLKKKINIQDSKNNHIDLSDLDLNTIIIKNSKRDIFNKDNELINYANYNSFIYDLDSIEKELGEKILPGKCLFEDSKEKPLKHFIFWNEGNKEILTMLANRYNQKKIDEKEKEQMMKFVKENYLGGKKMKEFYESFFILFFYLNEDKNELYLENNLNNLLDTIPPDLNLSTDFNNFLEKEGRDIKLNKLLEIFLYLEHLYFEINYNNIEDDYLKKEINDIENIKYKIEKLKIKDEFIKALRRYITRYLIGNKNILVELKGENLINEFYKSDLWGINEMKKFDDIKHVLNAELSGVNIKIIEAFSLYEIIGQKERENFKEFSDEMKLKNDDDVDDDDTLNKQDEDLLE